MFFSFMCFSEKNWTSGKIAVPDGVASLEALALVMSENLGLSFTTVPLKVTEPFSWSQLARKVFQTMCFKK